jgi:hypothetical protein
MPAKDLFHDAVRHALEKEGWHITHDPLYIRIMMIEMYIDLAAEKLLAAERDGRRIAVEVKSFVGASTISEFYVALGQFIPYREALAETDPDRVLYLAIPYDTYTSFFEQRFIKKIIEHQQVRLLVYDQTQEVITAWIS